MVKKDLLLESVNRRGSTKNRIRYLIVSLCLSTILLFSKVSYARTEMNDYEVGEWETGTTVLESDEEYGACNIYYKFKLKKSSTIKVEYKYKGKDEVYKGKGYGPHICKTSGKKL